mmetsp:Transcript_24140/g.52675  ORF Transcript_24140/g.52675 Transcript_24140/m.52675 type:complete len:473 (+) Transcript_24140:669-2087(+)
MNAHLLLLRLLVQRHVLRHDCPDLRVHVRPQAVLVEAVAADSEDDNQDDDNGHHHSGRHAAALPLAKADVVLLVVEAAASAGARKAAVGVLALHVLSLALGLALVHVVAAVGLAETVALKPLRALAGVGGAPHGGDAIDAILLQLLNVVLACRHLLAVNLLLGAPARGAILLARVGHSLALEAGGRVDAHALLAVAVRQLHSDAQALVLIFALLGTAGVLHSGSPARALALVPAEGVDAARLAVLARAAVLEPALALLALVLADGRVVADVRLAVNLEARAQRLQHRRRIQLAAVVAVIDDNGRVDGHVAAAVCVAHLGQLLLLQEGVGVVRAPHAGADMVHGHADGRDHALRALRAALRGELALRHLAAVRQLAHVVPPQQRALGFVRHLEDAELTEVFQDDVAAAVARVQVILGVGRTVLSVGQALLLALAAVEVLVKAVVCEVVGLELGVSTALKVLHVRVERLQKRHD